MAILENAPVTTILPVVNMKCARDFYENKLGLTPVGMRKDGKFVYACGGGAVIALFPEEGGSKADHTAVSFQVNNIDTAITELKSAGVVF